MYIQCLLGTGRGGWRGIRRRGDGIDQRTMTSTPILGSGERRAMGHDCDGIFDIGPVVSGLFCHCQGLFAAISRVAGKCRLDCLLSESMPIEDPNREQKAGLPMWMAWPNGAAEVQ